MRENPIGGISLHRRPSCWLTLPSPPPAHKLSVRRRTALRTERGACFRRAIRGPFPLLWLLIALAKSQSASPCSMCAAVVAGACLAVLGTLCGAVGKLKVRAGALQGDARGRWLGHAAMTLCGPALDALAHLLAPAALLAPLQSLDLVWNELLARHWLGEKSQDGTHVCNILCVVVGTASAALFASRFGQLGLAGSQVTALEASSLLSCARHGFLICSCCAFVRAALRGRRPGVQFAVLAGILCGNGPLLQLGLLLLPARGAGLPLSQAAILSLLGNRFLDRALASEAALIAAPLFEASSVLAAAASALLLRPPERADDGAVLGYTCSLALLVLGACRLSCEAVSAGASQTQGSFSPTPARWRCASGVRAEEARPLSRGLLEGNVSPRSPPP